MDNWKLTDSEVKFFKDFAEIKAKSGLPQVLWGWKRNGSGRSRTIYFSGDLALDKGNLLFIKRAYLYLKNKDLKDVIVEIGSPTDYDLKTVKRLLKRKPRLKIEPPTIISQSHNYDISKYSPFALYVGSGLSTESGLPLLGEIHKIFGVDDIKTREFIFADKDPLPERIKRDREGEFRKFCQFTVNAIKAVPSKSHQIIQKLFERGIVKQVFTDNVDDIFRKINVPFIQTRLSIFPDKFPTEFDKDAKSLLVIGIAVDRRQVIRQARRKGLKITVINPVMEVAPHSRNMDYLKKGDIFFKDKAKNILPRLKFS